MGLSLKLHCDNKLVCRTSFQQGEADIFQEETGSCTERTLRGRGTDDYTRIKEITSGRANFQQGNIRNLQRPPGEENKEGGGFWSGSWAHMSYEGRVMLSDILQ